MADYMIPSYAKSFNIGHRALANFFVGEDEVWRVEEKVDGSQASVTLREGKLYFRSKGRAFTEENPDDMFKLFVKQCQERQDLFLDSYIYRGEYLKSPKHGCLSYAAVPPGNFVIFDIEDSTGNLLDNDAIQEESGRLGFGSIALLATWDGGAVPPTLDRLKALLDLRSNLGGPTVEGVVIKRTQNLMYDAQLGKLMIAKYVSEAFKEDQKKTWKSDNPSRQDVVELLVGQYTSKMRLIKAVQAMKEAGTWTGELKDIGTLMQSFPADLLVDHEADIKDALFRHFWPHIKRGVTRPIPQMYKDLLAEEASTPQPIAEELMA